MRRLIFAALAALAALTLCGCSVVKELLGEDKYSELTGKLDTAWNEVGKDALAELTDDAWREVGFGKTLEWPDDTVASSLPKLRDGRIDYSYSGGDAGYIFASKVSESEYTDYLAKYTDIGYRKTVDTPPFTVLLTCDGTYVGFIYTGSSLSIFYADSFSRLNEIIATAGATGK